VFHRAWSWNPAACSYRTREPPPSFFPVVGL
jgi:hypothetical protein